MPITITPQSPGLIVGPGLQVKLQSDFIGPLPAGSEWVLDFNTPPDEFSAHTIIYRANSNPVFLYWDVPNSVQEDQTTGIVPVDGTTVNLVAHLYTDSTHTVTIDQGVATAPLETTAAISDVITKGKGQGALTEEQSLQLSETHSQSFLNISLDTLTTVDLTPGGPSPGPVNAQLPGYTFGVIVRLANIPADLLPQTPDDAYWVPTLATVRLFRGSDLWLRVPIHTPSKIIPFAATDLAVALATATVGQWILNLTIQVNFLPGVTGRVLLMKTP